MKDTELKNKVIKRLLSLNKEQRSYPKEFTAREIAESVGGYTPRIGFIQEAVIAELRSHGINASYVDSTNTKRFIIKKKEKKST